MEFFKERYKNAKGRSDSMYIYILYECSQEKIKEHIKKQLDILERVNDAYKRKLFSSRYFLLRDMVGQNPDDHVYNCVMFIDDKLNLHDLTKPNKNLLKKFDHQNISYVYDNHFKLNYLDDLLFNDEPYHMYRVNNNKIDYIQMTRTKKYVVMSKEAKPLNIQEFVDKTLPTNNKYVLYGISSKLKEHSDIKAYTVINKHVKDEDLLNIVDQIDQEDILVNFENDLLMIHDSKRSQKVIFKKELPTKIKNAQLEKLYIDVKMYDKFVGNMKKNQLDVSFKIITIDTSVKSFVEHREKIINQYGGVVGIAYY